MIKFQNADILKKYHAAMLQCFFFNSKNGKKCFVQTKKVFSYKGNQMGLPLQCAKGVSWQEKKVTAISTKYQILIPA